MNSITAPILLVDDEPANLLALEAVLEDLREPMVRASSGEQAMRLLRDGDFAAVLLDVHMPGMDGFETARLVRAQRRSRETPILFITADASASSAKEAYALGAVDFLIKPLKPHVLKAKLGFFIELHRSRRELQAAERQAVQDRVFLSAVLESIEDGIVACDALGEPTVVNRAARLFLGPLLDTPSEQLPDWLLQDVNGTSLPREQWPMARALEGDVLRAEEIVVASPGHAPRAVKVSGQALYDESATRIGAVVSLHDISADREAKSAREAAAIEQVRREEAEAVATLLREGREQLLATEERLRLATTAAGLGVWMWDAVADLLTFENARMHEVFGLPEGSPPFSSREFFEVYIHPDDAEAFRSAMAATLEGAGRMRLEGRILRASDREMRWIEATAILQPVTRGPWRILGTVEDITERHRVQDDLRRLADELAESDRRKSEFLATLAHELRNPLAPISNGLHLLEAAPEDAAGATRVRSMMQRQLNHLVHLVDDLLDIARISRDKVELRKTQLDLRDVIASALETSMPAITASGHELVVDAAPQPLPVFGDATRLAQVVSNLLNNAAKYTPAAGHIHLSAAREGGEARITVRDDGVGIAAEELTGVFDMFSQVGRNREHSQGGLGIGLALVRRLLAMHGGSVSAESGGPGRGSSFTVRLPLQQEPVVAAAPDDGGPEAHEPSALRILVVDDNVDAADSLAMLLGLQGHDTRVAHGGDQALQEAAQFQPQLVFLDIGMPGKDGYAVARELRQAPHGRDCILVALTGWGAQDDRARARDAGFDHHLTKPAGLDAVHALLLTVEEERVNGAVHEPARTARLADPSGALPAA